MVTQDPSAEGNTGYITDLDIRIWLRDNDPEANLLIEDYEFTPEEMRTAKTLTVDKWNDTPPFMNGFIYDVNTFPFRSAFIMGAAANLLYIAAHRYRRNSLRYQVPGGAVADQEKDKDYDGAADRLSKQYTDWVNRTKRAINMEQGFAMVDGYDFHRCGYR
jgi:hypothetical protein